MLYLIVERDLSHGHHEATHCGSSGTGEQSTESFLTVHPKNAVNCILVAGNKWEKRMRYVNPPGYLDKATWLINEKQIENDLANKIR